jgi:hypothetical protein
MQLTRIDPADFVFNNDAISTSCWRDASGNPIGDTETTPSWEIQNVSYQVNSSTGQLANYYIGDPANIQFSWTSLPSSYARKTGNPFQRALYGAIRNIIVGDTNADITWGGNAQSVISIISISKNCLKSSLLPGSFRIGNYTDDSNMNPPRILNCGRAYNLILGETLPGGGFTYGSGPSGTPAGLFLPDVGLIIGSVTFTPSTFVLRTENLTPTNHVFIRAQNNQYNYSMNPSFISTNSGYIINRDWYNNPQTYITTVGLYNDDNELMATAKLPRPYNKNFNNELLMQIGLNF